MSQSGNYQPPRTPEEIYDYMHEEFTPYASLTNREEAKKHIVDMIDRYVKSEIQRYKNSIELP